MKQCPKCNETNHAPDAVFCHVCGCRLSVNKSKGGTGVVIVIVLIVIAIAMWVFFWPSGSSNTSTYTNTSITQTYSEPAEQYYMAQVRNTVQALGDATITNDYDRIAELYAYSVDRYHNIYNVTKYDVVERYKNYDDKFGVYNKTVSIRWNTLQVGQKSYGGYSVVYVEDYHIDRYDKSKYTDFVIEQHIELDDDYKIVSIYDVQLSKY